MVRQDGSTGFERGRKFKLRAVGGGSEAGEGGEKRVSVGEKLSKVKTLSEASAVVEENIKGQIAAALGVGVDEVDVQKSLFDFGGEFPPPSPSLYTHHANPTANSGRSRPSRFETAPSGRCRAISPFLSC